MFETRELSTSIRDLGAAALIAFLLLQLLKLRVLLLLPLLKLLLQLLLLPPRRQLLPPSLLINTNAMHVRVMAHYGMAREIGDALASNGDALVPNGKC